MVRKLVELLMARNILGPETVVIPPLRLSLTAPRRVSRHVISSCCRPIPKPVTRTNNDALTRRPLWHPTTDMAVSRRPIMDMGLIHVTLRDYRYAPRPHRTRCHRLKIA